MQIQGARRIAAAAATLAFSIAAARADEQLFGALKGAETLPEGASEFVQHFNYRSGKGQGTYWALDTKSELEHGFSDRFTGSIYLLGQALHTEGLQIDGYIPKDEKRGWRPSGVEASAKYNFLSPAKDPIGLSGYWSVRYAWTDPHSGQDKTQLSFEQHLLLQKYFLDGQLVWVGNFGMEATYARREAVGGLPPGFEWPTSPEMEIAFLGGTGLSYRFRPNWFLGVEAYYDTEFETEIGRERWSWQIGPSLHYGGKSWWATLSWLPQVQGGGANYPGQRYNNLHLIEKTAQEVRLKIGILF